MAGGIIAGRRPDARDRRPSPRARRAERRSRPTRSVARQRGGCFPSCSSSSSFSSSSARSPAAGGRRYKGGRKRRGGLSGGDAAIMPVGLQRTCQGASRKGRGGWGGGFGGGGGGSAVFRAAAAASAAAEHRGDGDAAFRPTTIGRSAPRSPRPKQQRRRNRRGDHRSAIPITTSPCTGRCWSSSRPWRSSPPGRRCSLWFDTLFGGWRPEPSLRELLTLLLVLSVAKFSIVLLALRWMPLRLALTPAATKTRRVRRRAIKIFKAAAERRTLGRTGILIYLSLGEHRAEIVADEAITAVTTPERWGEAMAALLVEGEGGSDWRGNRRRGRPDRRGACRAFPEDAPTIPTKFPTN